MLNSGRLRLAVLGGAALMLAGCQGVDAVVNHSELDVPTHLSESIFLDPVPPSARTIYVSARNTSDYPSLDLRTPLIQNVAARGYQVVDDPNQAHYMLRINVLSAGQLKDEDRDRALNAHFGEALLGGAIGAGVASALSGGNTAATVGAGLGVGLASLVINEAFKNVTYAVVVDVQLSERPLGGQKVYTHGGTSSASGNATANANVTSAGRYNSGAAYSGSSNSRYQGQEYAEMKDFKQYQLRDIAYVNKVNLKFDQAAPLLTQKLALSLANLFE